MMNVTKKTKGGLLASLLVTFSLASELSGDPADSARDLSELEVFTDGFPRTLYFRSGDIVKWHQRGVLDHHLGMFDADTRKYVGEETPFREDWIDIMAGFKERHPGKLSLLHLNGEARGVYRKEGHIYFPGHWTYYPGEILEDDLPANETRLKVADARVFSSRTYRKREHGRLTDTLVSPVIIVPLNPDGSKRWSESEYAKVLEINAAENALKLDRGEFFSKARDFSASRAYVAPIHSEYWGDGTMWTLNLSAKCPEDPQGRTAADIWLEEIADWCGPDGAAAHVDGIGFDVIFYKAKHGSWDIDADGEADDGIASSGEDFNTRGQHDLLKRLREKMGPEFILTSDGWEDRTQRAVGVFNGMESEGLSMPNDGWRKISQTINAQRYWAEQGNAKYNYSYITSKLRHPEDIRISDQLYRVGLGTACILGVSYTEARNPLRKDGLPMIPEMHRGQANEPNWLGQPVGEMRLLPKEMPDILNGEAKPFSPRSIDRIEAKNCRVSWGSDGALLVEGLSENPYEEMEITLRGIEVPAGDLTVFFEALAIEPLAGYDSSDRIPRQIIVHASGMPETPSDQMGGRPMYNDIMALMGTSDWQENCAYFRNAGAGPGEIDLTLRIENQGSCKIRNLTAHNAPLGLARDFEHGVVLVNASQETIEFDLATLFPATELAEFWRLKADPQAYLPGKARDRMLSIHNGRKLGASRIKLPALEGLFLSKTPQ
jgi:hypothetical protein